MTRLACASCGLFVAWDDRHGAILGIQTAPCSRCGDVQPMVVDGVRPS